MAPIGVYVHVPFCTVKCGYCDFNAYAGLHHLAEDYAAALVKELKSWSDVLVGRAVKSIFFGGGTPSEVPAVHIANVIEAVGPLASISPSAEISLEANPGTLTTSYLRELRATGVNRLSIGAQSFHDDELRFLDRIHSADATVAAVSLARDAGFENLSLDLIYGLPGQDAAAWLATLQQAVNLAPEHLSLYGLTVEEGTPLARRVRTGEVTMPSGDDLAELYESASDFLGGAGYGQYEVSNWSLPGFESRHNSVYWTWGEYLGIGAGAHGFLAGERFENIAHPRDYIAAVTALDSPHPGVANSYRPDRATAMGDWLASRLRLLTGFERGDFAAEFGVALDEVARDALRRCQSAGVLAVADRVSLTRRGRLLHGEVSAELLLACRAFVGGASPVSLQAG